MHFFHHFAGQPMQAENIPVLDPLAALILRSGRCGNVARFLVDLFECNGFPARLLTAGCHTSAEVLWQARWILADASLFPPGLSPVDDSGNPVGIEQVARSPELLDRCQSYINYHHEYVEAFLKAYPETASALDRYLRAPLLPSAAFFGAEYFLNGPRSYSAAQEAGFSDEWNADENSDGSSAIDATRWKRRRSLLGNGPGKSRDWTRGKAISAGSGPIARTTRCASRTV